VTEVPDNARPSEEHASMKSPLPTDNPRVRLGNRPWCVATAGLALVAAMVAAFTALLEDVGHGMGLARYDLPAVAALATARVRGVVILARVVTTVGSPAAMILIAAAVCGWLAWRLRGVAPLVIGVVGVGGIGAIDAAVKDGVARPRPPAELHAVGANGYSFPSGHAIFSALVILLCATLLTHWVVKRPGPRAALWAGSIILLLAVGISRVYLGVHYPSDVLAGWTLAIAWATTVLVSALLLAHTQRASRSTGSAAPPTAPAG
jgi:membrane-associated phospholipid phosphatase